MKTYNDIGLKKNIEQVDLSHCLEEIEMDKLNTRSSEISKQNATIALKKMYLELAIPLPDKIVHTQDKSICFFWLDNTGKAKNELEFFDDNDVLFSKWWDKGGITQDVVFEVFIEDINRYVNL